MTATELAGDDDGAARHDGGTETNNRAIHVEEGQGGQAAISGRKLVARADMICCPGDLRRIQYHALWISGGAGGHEADMAFYRWQWRDTLGARLLDEQFTLLPGDDLGIRGAWKALRFFGLLHKQHVWRVHTDRALAFFVSGVGSQGDEHVPSGQRAEPEHRIGHPTGQREHEIARPGTEKVAHLLHC